jgi:hypothetical protein
VIFEELVCHKKPGIRIFTCKAWKSHSAYTHCFLFLLPCFLFSVYDMQFRQEIVVPSTMAASGSSKICEVLQESALIPLVTHQITQ